MAQPSNPGERDRVFPALLKFWRGRRGFSQLDLGLHADVSSRHISFLETGRSRPSVEMVALLAESLDLSFRDRNEMLRAAGFAAAYPEPTAAEALAGPLGTVVDTMLRHGEPYPVMVIDRLYRVIRANEAAISVFGAIDADLTAPDVDLLGMIFRPTGRNLIENWDEFAGTVLRRLQKEVMHRPQDDELNDLLDRLLAADCVPEEWRQPNLERMDNPMIPLIATFGDLRLRFLTTITAFSAPNNVALDELRIEAYYPLDDTTDAFCQSLARPPNSD